MRVATPFRAAAVGGLMALFAAVVLGEDKAKPKEFGVGNLTTYVVPSFSLAPMNPSVTWDSLSGGFIRYVTGGTPPQLAAGVQLPDGASIVMVEVDGCDTTGTSTFTGTLYTMPPQEGNGAFALVQVVGGNNAGQPGCAGVEQFLTPNPHTVHNAENLYFVAASNSPGDGTSYVKAIKIFYELQVGPQPATPTFNDVPTSDPAYQFIEAFAASGITGGCGGGNFCPDSPVTRRQIAVFFAKALGLYWPY